MNRRIALAALWTAVLSVTTPAWAQKYERVFAKDGSGVFGYKDNS